MRKFGFCIVLLLGVIPFLLFNIIKEFLRGKIKIKLI